MLSIDVMHVQIEYVKLGIEGPLSTSFRPLPYLDKLQNWTEEHFNKYKAPYSYYYDPAISGN